MKTLWQFVSIAAWIVLSFNSCSINRDDITQFENSATVVSAQLFHEVEGTGFSIESAVVNGNILEVKVATGGCNPKIISARLIDSGSVAESFPVQRYAKIQLSNSEPDCYMHIVKSFMFDLKPLRVQGERKVSIHLQGWKGELLYVY